MSYPLAYTFALSSAGLSLEAQIKSTSGVDVGSPITTGFVDLGGTWYSFYTAAIPTAQRGSLVIRALGGGAALVVFSINPEEAENADDKTTSRMATFAYTAPDNTGISAIKVVTEHLATALELSSAAYRFTLAALANAPVTGTADLSSVATALSGLQADIEDLLARIGVDNTILVTRTVVPGEPITIYNGEAYPNGISPAFTWIDTTGKYNPYIGEDADLIAYQDPSDLTVLSSVTISAVSDTVTRFVANSVDTDITSALAAGAWRYYVRINVSTNVRVIFSPSTLQVVAP